MQLVHPSIRCILVQPMDDTPGSSETCDSPLSNGPKLTTQSTSPYKLHSVGSMPFGEDSGYQEDDEEVVPLSSVC